MSDEQSIKIDLNEYSHSVRASQSVLQYGVGNIVDFPEQTLMTAAPKYWKDQVVKKHDGRLEKLLHVTHFGMPGSKDQNCPRGISYVRFPEWYFCPKCRRFMPLSKWYKEYKSKAPSKSLEYDEFMVKNLRCYECRQSLVITRIITVCPNGHIDDFPWVEWTHCKNLKGAKSVCDDPVLKFTTSLSGSEGLEGLTLTCTKCGAKATLRDAFTKNIFKTLYKDYNGKYDFTCKGKHPWKNIKEICEYNNEKCFPEVRQRGASSIYFPITASSLVIPPYSDILQKKIENSKAFEEGCIGIKAIKDNKYIPDDKKDEAIRDEIKTISQKIADEISIGVPVDQIRKILEQRWMTQEETTYTTDSYEYRSEEYSALSGQITIKGDDNDFSRESTNISEYKLPYITNISLIHKVREVQALLGYSRMYPVESMNSKNSKAKPVSIRDKDMDWYPAYEVRGEGIFIEFDNNYLEKWLSNSAFVNERITKLTGNFANSFFGKERTKVYTSKFLLLHTISHLLIKQLSFECGYGIASLKERIYCSKANEQKKMAGILIYTASGDSEGTLGGLVRQGRSDTFPGLFKKALQTALTCSNDPVCSCSNGQGRDSLNLAACYSCALIPETSCEEFNTFLDRGIVVGTMEYPDEGIYSPQLTLKEDWKCTVTKDSKHENVIVTAPEFDVKKSSGTDLSDDTYIDIWNYLEEYSENENEKKILKQLKDKNSLFENKEKPFRECSGKSSLSDSSLQCDLVWFNSKVIYFSAEGEEDYETLRTYNKDWTIFCGADESFNVDDFIKSIGEK